MSNVNPHVNSKYSKALVDVLATIGNEITAETLSKLKVILRGHVNKEALDYADTGSELLLILHKRGLVTNKRLAFLRKLLKETKCFRLLTYIDGYEDKNRRGVWAHDEGFIEASSRQSARERRLQGLIERIENEIKFYEDNEENVKQDIEGLQSKIEETKTKIIDHEDCVLKTKSVIKTEHLNSQAVEKRLEGIKFVIRKLYREEESLNEKLSSTKPKKIIHDELVAKHAEIIGNQLVERELLKKYENISEKIRLSYTDLRHKTADVMDVEKEMQDDTSKLRNLKKEVSKNMSSAKQLKETLIEIRQDLEEVECLSPYTPQSSDSSRQTRQVCSTPASTQETLALTITPTFKMVDYNELIKHTEPLVIGRKGRKSDPPEFIFPCSIAIDIRDNIYIADSINQRIQVLHMNGSLARKPIEVGKFQPSVVAVASNGKIFVSDSHVVRVYSSVGEPLCYILPIYGKTDLRPKITGLATVNDDAILIVDKANRRVLKFRQDGTLLCFIGGSHVFQSPFGITVAKNGDIVISESNAHCLKIFNGDNGSLKKVFGTKGIGKGKFLYPRGIAMDNENNIIVADSGNHQIQILNTEDGEGASFGSLGSMPGFFDTPYDVALSNDGEKIVVVEARNNRLQVFTRAVLDHCIQDSFTDTAKEDGSEIEKNEVWSEIEKDREDWLEIEKDEVWSEIEKSEDWSEIEKDVKKLSEQPRDELELLTN